MLTQTRLDEILDTFPDLHILVVGDFFLDKYLIIDPALNEPSLETGLDAYQVIEIRRSPGAAGTVVSNLRAMNVQVSALSVIGDDGNGFELKDALLQQGVNVEGLLESSKRFTPTYTKPMLITDDEGEPERELNRLDIKNRTELSAEFEEMVIAHLERVVPNVDGIIIADQVSERNCGVITDAVRAHLSRLAREYPEKTFTADSRERIGEFESITLKPNVHEAQAALQGTPMSGPDTSHFVDEDAYRLMVARICGETLNHRTQKPTFVTLGKQGILLVEEGSFTHLPTLPVSGPIDVVGAGDSVIAALTSALCAGATAKEAATLGNIAASVTVHKIGTTGTASRAELRANIPSDSEK